MRNNNIERSELGGSVSNPFDIIDSNTKDPLKENLDNIKEEVKREVVGETREDTSEKKFEEPQEPVTREEDTSEEEPRKEEEDDVANVKIKTNVTKLLASRLKEEGQLPEDFEVTEDTTSSDVELAYRRFMEDRIRNEIKSEELARLRDEEGVDEEILSTAKRLKYGVSDQEIEAVEIYRALGSAPIKEEDENYEAMVNTLFKQYYIDKNLSPKEADINAKRDLEDLSTSGELESFVKERQSYFLDKSEELDQAQREKVEKAVADRNRKAQESVDKIKGILDKGVIDGVKYDSRDLETVRKALFEKSEVIVDGEGRRIRVTPYYKKKYERAMDEEKSLKDIVDFILGYDLRSVAETSKKVARKKIVDDLNDLISVEVDLSKRDSTQHRKEESGGGIERRPLL